MSDYKSTLQSHNDDLQELISMANELPDKIEGTQLNFEIVGGTTQPSNPVENTIWINTSNAITNYHFSVESPEEEEGVVWITIGTTSDVEFSPLKDNTIKIYPLRVKQYISGTWIEKVVKTYQNGAWVDWWNSELYNLGDEYTHITGGFTSFCPGIVDLTSMGTATKYDTYMYLYANGTSSAIGPAKMIDLTHFNKLNINFTSSSSNNRRGIAVSKTKKYSDWAASIGASSTGVKSVNISSLTGEYYVFVYTWAYSTYPESTKFDKIWLE